MKKLALCFLLVATACSVARAQQSNAEGFACTAPSAVTLAPVNAPLPDTAIVPAVSIVIPATAVSVTATQKMEPVKVTPKPTIIQPVPKTLPPPQLKVANAVTGTINPVEFLSGSTQLTSDSKLILNEMASILSTVDWESLTIIGNTDNQGNPTDNKILSLKRATIVRSYLISKGLPFRKLKVRGDGGSNPIDSNKTPLGRRLNRRIDFTLEN